ncbi:hypothetical protein B5P46_19840 [Rhizobium leguminosarum]|uniref:Uncharacterized protein n=1 Tax=Rhizobium leguminosarum TaxID=384 RepID=A0A4Q1U0J1_RHILE|nr:hypothetical protein B5P46_19840 [Rhizobium leguminosarum]
MPASPENRQNLAWFHDSKEMLQQILRAESASDMNADDATIAYVPTSAISQNGTSGLASLTAFTQETALTLCIWYWIIVDKTAALH